MPTRSTAQAAMQDIAQEIGVNRVLILHQFKNSMLPDKTLIQKFPNVELVIDSDGTFGYRYQGVQLFAIRKRTGI